MKGKIGLFDSGLGGISILKELISVLPNEDYLFYEDSIHNPYGEKTEEELMEYTSSIVEYLLKEGCKIIVIACNTATTACMSKLRKKYTDTIFVGTVPAIKAAYDHNCHFTLVLSTPYTMKSHRVQELLRDYKREDQQILNISGENLAYLIDLNEMEEVDKVLSRILSRYVNIADSVVLGCTHYSLIKDRIQKVLPGAILLDGAIGVAMEVKHQLENHQLLTSSLDKGNITIVNSRDESYIKRSFELLER